MKTSKAGEGMEADSAQMVLAERIAKDVVECDPSILSLIVLDSLGRVLAVGRSSRLAESEQVSRELIPMFGTIVKVILGAANNAAQAMGGTEHIIGVFKRQKVLLINLPEYNLSLGLRLARSANAEYVYNKIKEILGSS
ncbi:MAG: hypothetical protein OK455_05520 [Thaumarchaeota archaeon]|nr:hypothetical protein [Nitrososphaerota archaeon]